MPPDYEDLYDISDLDDEELNDLVVQQLAEYPELDPELLTIDVQNGFVLVTGRVGTESELQLMEKVLGDLLGLDDYSNEVVIDELVRAEQSEAADEAAAEDQERVAQTGDRPLETEDAAQHLIEDLEAELHGTHDMQDAIESGRSYEAPDRPVQEGTWSEENH